MDGIRREWHDLRQNFDNNAEAGTPDYRLLDDLENLTSRAIGAIPAGNEDIALKLRIGLLELGVDLDEDGAGNELLRDALGNLEKADRPSG